jgi:4-hydroxybenzoate polyprenyltransferase
MAPSEYPSQVLSAYLELVRPANVATAVGDVLAGFAVAGLGNPSALPWLLVSTACLYAGGVVLNDVFDRHSDSKERPERPIPSGRVPVVHAALLGALLLAAGVVTASIGTREAGYVALAIAAAVLLYDSRTKTSPVLGPANMGLCRGLNLGLGMASVSGTLALHWPLCAIPVTYIAGVTLLSRGEVSGGRHSSATFSLLLVALAITGLLFATMSAGSYVWASLACAALFSWRVIPAFVAARRTPTPAAIREAVRRGVLSLVLLDAALATTFAGPAYGLVLLATALGAIWLGRRFSVT